MAGLTVGLLGVDPIELELRKEAELPSRDREDAKKIWDVVASHHWLLCTLLLVNAAASEALPLCLNAIMPEYVVIVVSVTLVLVFGEIFPSAVFTGPRRVRLAAACVPFVRALMWLTAPLSWPMARALDRVVGEGHASTRLDRAQIGTLIGLHRRARSPARRPPRRPPRRARASGVSVIEDADENARESSPLLENTDQRRGRPARLGNIFARLILSRVWFTFGKDKVSAGRGEHRAESGEPRAESRERAPGIVSASPRRAGVLSDDEVTIVRETLKLAHKTVFDAMTPLRDVHMLPWESTAFDEDTLAGVLGAGFSRVPVFRGGNRHNVVGTLMVKKLIVLDPNERRHVRDVPLRAPLLAHPDAGLLETLNAFQAGRSHMALVTKHASLLERAWRRNEDVAAGAVRILGIITVEDVLEELIGEEIQDEDDYAETLTRRELTRGGTAEESASRTVDTKGVPSVRLAFDERRRRELGVADDATRDVSDCAPIRNPEDVSRRASRLQARGVLNEDAIVAVSPSKRVCFAEDSARAFSRGREEHSELPPAVFAAARKFKLLLARRRARRLRRSDSLESRDEHASGAS